MAAYLNDQADVREARASVLAYYANSPLVVALTKALNALKCGNPPLMMQLLRTLPPSKVPATDEIHSLVDILRGALVKYKVLSLFVIVLILP